MMIMWESGQNVTSEYIMEMLSEKKYKYFTNLENLFQPCDIM